MKKPKSIKVMHVDDDDLTTEFYRIVLSEKEHGYGYHVETMRSAAQFMDRIQQGGLNDWDVIILDVMMPHPEWEHFSHERSLDGMLTGALLVEPIRKLLPQVKIVFLTNRPETEIREVVPDMSITVYGKFDFPPFDFAAELHTNVLGRKPIP
jgi:CheY-like chemotaxis protein